MTQPKEKARKTVKLDPKFLVNIEGKDFVLYAGLLDLATQIGLALIEVELVQIPSKENGNFAICKATALTKNGEQFIDYGDASPSNCNSRVAPHLIRMASTRSKARALRDLTNVGITALEELGDFSEVIGETPASKTKTPQKKVSETSGKDNSKDSKTQAAGKTGGNGEKKTSKKEEPTTTASISQAQERAIQNLGRRRGIKPEELEKRVRDTYRKDVSELNTIEASGFIKVLQTAA